MRIGSTIPTSNRVAFGVAKLADKHFAGIINHDNFSYLRFYQQTSLDFIVQKYYHKRNVNVMFEVITNFDRFYAYR